MGISEIISSVAAVVSAVGGTFAAVAAFRSAESARVAQQAGTAAKHRAALRQVNITAAEVLIEAERIADRGKDNPCGQIKLIVSDWMAMSKSQYR